MSNYKEIVTKAVISKGKKEFVSDHSIKVENPSTILGCWVINHNFSGKLVDDKVIIDGSYDVNIWYSSDNDTKTRVGSVTNNYHEVVNMSGKSASDGEEIIVRSLKQPTTLKASIDGDSINYTIDMVLGIELVGDIKVKIEANMEEDPWDDIVDDKSKGIEAVDGNFIKDVI